MASQADVRYIEQQIEEAQAATITVPSELSLWDQFKIAITPESHAESIVNEIYSTPSRTLKTDPYYNVQDLSSPNIYVTAKGELKDTLSAVTGFAGKGALIIGAFLLVAVAIYAIIPALIKR